MTRYYVLGGAVERLMILVQDSKRETGFGKVVPYFTSRQRARRFVQKSHGQIDGCEILELTPSEFADWLRGYVRREDASETACNPRSDTARIESQPILALADLVENQPEG